MYLTGEDSFYLIECPSSLHDCMVFTAHRSILNIDSCGPGLLLCFPRVHQQHGNLARTPEATRKHPGESISPYEATFQLEGPGARNLSATTGLIEGTLLHSAPVDRHRISNTLPANHPHGHHKCS